MLIAPIGYLGLPFLLTVLTLYTALITILAKNSLSDPINLDDMEVLQQLTKHSSPSSAILIIIFFLINLTASL
jgi:hypothetical protein